MTYQETPRQLMKYYSPGLGLGRVRSPTMCSWHLPFPFCQTILQKKWNWNKMKQISKTNRVRATIPGICARTVVSCWKSAHARGAVREPRESIIVCRDLIGRAIFLAYLFLVSFFSHRIEISYENDPQNTPKVGTCAYGLHRRAHRGPRSTQNYIKNKLIPETICL